MNVSDIIKIIARRDNVSYKEARTMVLNCQDELCQAIEAGGSYDDICNIIYDWLGLEPDYLDILVPII